MKNKQGRHLWPELTYNPITMIGGALALFAVAAILIFHFLSLRSETDNPYTGIFILVVFPSVLVFGLILIPIGMFLEQRRRNRGEVREFIVDLKNATHRRALLLFGAGTAVFLLGTTAGLYETYHYTESVSFCGEVCHVMHPEHTTFLASSHARVACVHCHVGPGGDDYIKSKMSGARQLWHLAKGDYPRPIHTPVYTLRPSEETCGECHWTNAIHDPRVVVRDHYLSDRSNRKWRIELLFNTDPADSTRPSRVPDPPRIDAAGTGGMDDAEDRCVPRRVRTGIDWHTDRANAMTYVAEDSSRQSFRQVTWYNNGQPVTYALNGVPLGDAELEAKRVKGLVREMECTDCHNRPAHRYLSPVDAVNRALDAGDLSAAVPWIKREAVRALTGTWESREEAHASIAAHLESFYAGQGIALPPGTIEAVQKTHDSWMFPDMRVRWDAYPENQGHLQFPGCFRCHGSPLTTPEGTSIRSDCNLCHTILSQHFVDEGPLTRARFDRFRHPIDVKGADTALHCTECHGGDGQLYNAQKEQ